VARRILYLSYTNPTAYPPLEHSSRILAEAGWQVRFLGTGSLGADDLRFPPHPNIRVRLLPYCKPGWKQKVHYVLYCCWVLGWVLFWRPRWVYASDHLVGPIALLVSFLPGRRVIYHEHDTPPASPTSRFIRSCVAARKRLAARAAVCVVPNEERAHRFREHTGTRNHVVSVWNCPSREEVGPVRAPLTDGTITLFYHGSIVPSQLPLTVVHALARLPDRIRLRIAGYETIGHKGYIGQLQQLAGELGVGARVAYLGIIPMRAALLEQCRSCDIGLTLFTKETVQPMAGASNKPFDYLASGLTLLVSSTPEWTRFFVDPGYGLSCDAHDADSIAEAVRWLLEHPEQLRQMGEAGRQRVAAAWNYEAQFAPVLQRIEHG
jgi:glycosyltransferase involved in cell wall biosynthesis